VQHQLRPLLALTDARVPGFEQVPTARELGVPVRGSVWGGLVAPRGLPVELRNKLEAACKRATDATLYKARAQAANSPLVWRDGEAFKRFALAESAKLRQVVIENGLVER
jgi:tripartite-type tricarboxylate transporter receptor subunit TctC